MVEFCTCGSLIINDQCSNKNCEHRVNEKTKSGKTVKKRTTAAAKASKSSNLKTASSSASSRRNSKCITYTIEELEQRKGNTVEE